MSDIITDIKALKEETLLNLQSSKARNTVRAYKSDFNDFALFCAKNGFKPLPSEPKIVSLYLTHLSTKDFKISSSQDFYKQSVSCTGCFREIGLKFTFFIAFGICFWQRIDFLRDVGPDFCHFLIKRHPDICTSFCIRQYSFRRAFRFTNTAINTFIGVYHKHVFSFVKAVNRTDLNAICVFAHYTFVINDIGHQLSLSFGNI